MNIESCLKTRRGFKYYFKFPDVKKTLVVEIGGAVAYASEHPTKFPYLEKSLKKEEVFPAALKEYEKYKHSK